MDQEAGVPSVILLATLVVSAFGLIGRVLEMRGAYRIATEQLSTLGETEPARAAIAAHIKAGMQ
jgi:hypothetical protein